MKCVSWLFALFLSSQNVAHAQTIVPVSTIQPGEILSVSDLRSIDKVVSGALQNAQTAIGMEARTVLYAGRPIHLRDIGPPAVIERNQIVNLIFSVGGMSIVTEGRALGRASVGEVVRVMNMASRTTISGRADISGSVRVN